MGWIVVRSLLIGIAGLIIVPVVVFFLTLGLASLFDPNCGGAGDSGGCAMGSASIALVSALPGFAVGFIVSLLRGLRARKQPAGEQPRS